MNGELVLSGLEYLTELNGLRYTSDNPKKEIPPKYRRAFRDYVVMSYVIGSKTPNKVKLDIFKRLNTKGKRLTGQEVRNSVTNKAVRNLYKIIESDESFKSLVVSNVNTNRFVHHEFILRYFGAYFTQVENVLEYKGNSTLLLDSVLDYLNHFEVELGNIVEKYLKSLEKCKIIFGDNAFRKPPGKTKSSLNTLLYSQLLILIPEYEINGEDLSEKFFEYMNKDKEFIIYLSSGTNNTKNISVVNAKIRVFLDQHLRRIDNETNFREL